MEFTSVAIYPKLKISYALRLEDFGLVYSRPEGAAVLTKRISFSDVLGCCVKRLLADGATTGCVPSADGAHSIRRGSDDSLKRRGASVVLYWYPAIKKGGSGVGYRKRQCTTFVFSSADTFDDNSKDAERACSFIRTKLKCIDGLVAASSTAEVQPPGRFSKKVLVLINPKSGSGRASNAFYYQIKPMFEEASLEYEVQTTSYAGHAIQMMKDLNLADWYGIVIISGDGLTFEIYQGLMSRPDWQTAVKIPVGVLPGGSGNALCCSVNYTAGEPVVESGGGPAIVHSAYLLLKHDIVPMDLVAIDTLDRRLYSFLSVTWGMVADIDIDSEKFRSLGNFRFTVGAVSKILSLKKYRGRVSFWPLEPYSGKTVVRAGANLLATGASLSTEHGSNGAGDSDESPLVHDADAPASSNGDSATFTEASQLPDVSLHSVAAAEDGEAPKKGLLGEAVVPATSGRSMPQPAFVTMPALGDPLPAGWVTVEDDFVTVLACYQTHLGPDAVASPSMTFDAGHIELLLLRSANVNRGRMLQLFTQMETGAHVHSPFVEIIRVAAFRIEPAVVTETGNLTVDGERVRYGAIQGYLLPAAARLMAKRPQRGREEQVNGAVN